MILYVCNNDRTLEHVSPILLQRFPAALLLNEAALFILFPFDSAPASYVAIHTFQYLTHRSTAAISEVRAAADF
jgi:hypothetical protein